MKVIQRRLSLGPDATPSNLHETKKIERFGISLCQTDAFTSRFELRTNLANDPESKVASVPKVHQLSSCRPVRN